MAETGSPYLISTEQLAAELSAPDLVVVDASWYLPTQQRDAHAEYLGEHIPGAVFFDIDAISDMSTDLPHMLARPEQFSSAMRKLGIGDGQRVVVYDGAGLFSAARVWWTFRTMGTRDVAVLDGGLPKWKAEGRPLEEGPVRRQERHYTARLDNGAVRDFTAVRAALQAGSEQVVDARSAERFSGTTPEPRPGLRAGHAPGSFNVPFGKVLNTDGTLKDPAAIRAEFEAAGVDLSRPVVTSCGSGVTAAVLSLALAVAGHRHSALYDGSWAEWGGRDDAPVETG